MTLGTGRPRVEPQVFLYTAIALVAIIAVLILYDILAR